MANRLALACASGALLAACTRQAVGPSPGPSLAPSDDPTTGRELHRPLTYNCAYTAVPPSLDGELVEGAWEQVPWSDLFGDIEGSRKPAPRFATRMKMLWDDEYLYIAAEMEEPHIWGTYTTRDQIVFHEHDFEVFIDPDGDTAAYYELEVNVLGTIFDLYLHRMYRLGGPADHSWDCAGLKTAIGVRGTTNDPSDRDTGWTVEWAIPFACLVPPPAHAADSTDTTRGGAAPTPGQTWRINFSRVEWLLQLRDGRYEKVPGMPEDNWTWTPQWAIDMHLPRHWGCVTFVKEATP
ncbi:MAG: carbohydrate-binding family 9-like protein [Planctomycetota bacterium]|nr:carbohydrate-binding family 9-like protein [Planctomycetota bacterium]MDA1105713.1 carbohydrate-binding family 9-like protein [Planctomycetota bacterium]